MHILTMTVIGLILVGLIYGSFRMITSAGSSRWIARAAGGFVFAWLVVTAISFYFGVAHAGYSVGAEVAAHAVIFGVPVAAALYAAIRASRHDSARPA